MQSPISTALDVTTAAETTPLENVLLFSLKWGPRVLIVGFAGYYSLGVAYHWGVMAAIDRIAMDILVHQVGYAGIGAIMPTFQWYAAWGVRITVGLAAGVVYDVFARVIYAVYEWIQSLELHKYVYLSEFV